MKEKWNQDLLEAASLSPNVCSRSLWTATESLSFHFLNGPRDPFLIKGKYVKLKYTIIFIKEKQYAKQVQRQNRKIQIAKWQYIDTGSLIESSITLTASSFLFGSKTNSISAAAALCVNESAEQETKHKISGNYNNIPCNVYIGYFKQLEVDNDLYVYQRKRHLSLQEISHATDYKTKKPGEIQMFRGSMLPDVKVGKGGWMWKWERVNGEGGDLEENL